MKIDNNVRSIPKFLNKIYPKGFTSFGRIYLNRKILDDLKTDNPTPHNVSILIHEQEHLRKKDMTYWIRYTIFPKVRLNEELSAYNKQFQYLRSKGESYDIENISRKLSGPRYLFATDYKTAKKLLEDLWNKA